jgi:hypothetical protein
VKNDGRGACGPNGMRIVLIRPTDRELTPYKHRGEDDAPAHQPIRTVQKFSLRLKMCAQRHTMPKKLSTKQQLRPLLW